MLFPLCPFFVTVTTLTLTLTSPSPPPPLSSSIITTTICVNPSMPPRTRSNTATLINRICTRSSCKCGPSNADEQANKRQRKRSQPDPNKEVQDNSAMEQVGPARQSKKKRVKKQWKTSARKAAEDAAQPLGPSIKHTLAEQKLINNAIPVAPPEWVLDPTASHMPLLQTIPTTHEG
ncbi:hypothetical protein BYT27DRAFT_7257995 [Phlegmacium glaucopus]|nr:hypothetical protein BYT27DRAFT_7257995 [Phlegmacium glaucopus]